MYTIQDICDSLSNDTNIINHLFDKIPTKEEWIFEYRPNPDQRSLKELLEYMSLMWRMIATITKSVTYDQEELAKVRGANEGLNVEEDFKTLMTSQLKFVTSSLKELSENDLSAEIDPFGKWAMQRKMFILNTLLKTYTAYRMQLFLYLKDSGQRHLNTSNVWMWQDA